MQPIETTTIVLRPCQYHADFSLPAATWTPTRLQVVRMGVSIDFLPWHEVRSTKYCDSGLHVSENARQ